MPGLHHSTDTLVCRDPATGELLAELPHYGQREIDTLVDNARPAQAAWAATSAEQRSQVFADALRVLIDTGTELLRLLAHDCGKTMRWGALEELIPTAERLEYLATHYGAGRSLVPHGVIALMMGHRTPLFDVLAIGATALAAGNAVVLKPDARSTWCTLEFARVLRDALTSRGYSSALLSVVTGDEEAERLLRGADVDVVATTQPEHTSPRVRSWVITTNRPPPSFDRVRSLLAPLGGPRPCLFLTSPEVREAWNDALRQVLPSLSDAVPTAEDAEIGVPCERDRKDAERVLAAAVRREGALTPLGRASLLSIDNAMDAVTGQRLDAPLAILSTFRDIERLGVIVRGMPRPIAAVLLMDSEEHGRALGRTLGVDDLYLSAWGAWARPVYGPPTSDHQVDLRRMGTSQAVTESSLRDLVSSGHDFATLDSLVRSRFGGGPLPRVQAAASLLRGWWSNRQ